MLSAYRVTDSDWAGFFRLLSSLFSAGVPLLESLLLIKNNSHIKFQLLLSTMIKEVESGETLSKSLGIIPYTFNSIVYTLIAVGENSGTLDRTLSSVSDYLEKRVSVKQKIVTSLCYPVCILLAMCVVCSILLLFVLPQVQLFYQHVDTPLPWITRALLMGMSIIQREKWVMLGIGICIVYYLYSRWSQYVFLLPIIGKLMSRQQMIDFFQNLSLLYSAGISLQSSIEILCGLTRPSSWQQALHHIQIQIAQGRTLGYAINLSGEFPHLVSKLISIGEQAGCLDSMFNKVAEIYRGEQEQSLNRIGQLAEPLIMMIIGLVVGTIIFALYLPMAQLGRVIH